MAKKAKKKTEPKVVIQDSYDSFTISVGEERFHIDQEDTRKKLVKVFAALGIKAKYEEVF